MTIIYTLLGVPYVAVLDPVRGVVLQKAARKRIPSPGQMSLFAGSEPKEGDTKVENGVTYRLNQNSRWERTDKAKGTAKAKPKAVVPVVEEKAESKAKAKSKSSDVADMRQRGDTGSRRDEVKPMPNFEVVSDRASQPPGTIFYDDPAATPEQRAWMEYGGQNYIPATIASKAEIDNTFPDVAQAAAKARKYGYQGADDYEVLARYMAGGAARNVGSQNVYPVYFEDEPTPVAAEVVVDEPKPKQRLGDRMRAIAQELRQETEAQKQYTARMLGAAAQLAQNQDNLIDEVVDMVNEDLDTPEALPEPTIGDMLAEQKAEEESRPKAPSEESDIRALADLVRMRHYHAEPTKMDKGELDKAPVLRDYLVGAGLVTMQGNEAFLMPDAELPDFVNQDFPELAEIDKKAIASAYVPKQEKQEVEEEKPKREFMSNRRKIKPWMMPDLLNPNMTEEEEANFLAYSDDGISGSEPDREEERSDYPWTEDLELRPLIGSPKQRDWADDIRERAVKNFWEDGDYPYTNESGGWDRYAQAALELPIEAKWWIDNRKRIYAAIAERMGVKYSAGLRLRPRR